MFLPTEPDQDFFLVMAEGGLKLQFSAKYHRLVLIEIYLQQAKEKDLQIELCGHNISYEKQQLDLDKVQKLMKLSPVP